MTSPDSLKKPVTIKLRGATDSTYDNEFKLHTDSTQVQGPVLLQLTYSSVYRNFDNKMQIGHIYGDPTFFGGAQARVSGTYVQGNLTNQADIDYLAKVNDGKVIYEGVATYMEKLHLADGNRNGPKVDGTSNFTADFVNKTLSGELSFTNDGSTYMPADGKVAINANISGNTFANENVDNTIHTSGGFYGEDAQYLGGVYQKNISAGGSGTTAGTGTTFQGTFGAVKQ